MAQDSFDQEENTSAGYHKDLDAARNAEDSGTDGLVTSIRSDMVVPGGVTPAQKSEPLRINFNLIVGIWLALIVIFVLWFMGAGPGKHRLESGLAALVRNRFTPTPVVVLPTGTPTKTPQPTYTPFSRRTVNPTRTSVVVSVISPTPLAATLTPTSTSSGCRDVSTVTLADVGQTLCVQGTILETVEKSNYFMVVFNSAPGSFYWVTYDLVWSQAKVKTCYRTTGKIEQIGNSPMLKFNYANLPEVCQ